jgi:glyoxylase-like metal-dependent hydrolase (beta-lactamase superfamily II)/ferredoxin
VADRKKRLDTNVPGNFFVDATCINCDTCRQLAPATFEEAGEYSAVMRQPTGEEEEHRAYLALLACPVGSIGAEHSDKVRLQTAKSSFPLHLDGGVFYCGFNSDKSYGANSFFVRHPDGNWLIDSPRYLKHLVEAFERMGGLAHIFLTHEDDVADAAQYAGHFGARRIIHRADAKAMPDAEFIWESDEPQPVSSHFTMIPVPGHTPGSSALLYRNTYLFTGDHLWWEPEREQLQSPRQLVWNHRHLLHSIEKLLDLHFEWVLAGHGDRVQLSPHMMRAKLQELLESRLVTRR